MFFSTSDNYSQNDIIENYGLVDSTVVIGANIFRDVFASFRDIVGGETKGYKKDLESLKRAVQNELEIEAKKLGANAVIALKVDMDEISGSGKSMFMYQMVGTAVKLNKSITTKTTSNEIESISAEDFLELRRKVNARNKVLNTSRTPDGYFEISENDWWDDELSKAFVKEYFYGKQNTDGELSSLIEGVEPKYFISDLTKNLDKIYVSYLIYCLKSISKHNWFDVSVIIQILSSDSHITRFRGLHILYADRVQYSKKGERWIRKNFGVFD